MKVRIGQRQMGYESVGTGRPLVLLHPFPFDGRLWRKVSEGLASSCRVITPDLRGFGQSELGTGSISIADMADDVAALLDELGLARATVGGMSMGGYISLAFAQRHANRLEGLVLADTKAAADTPEAKEGRSGAIDLVEKEGVAALVERQIPRLLSASASPTLRAEVRAMGASQPTKTVVQALRAMRDRPDRQAELGNIACPTLVVVGTEDSLTSRADCAAMAAQIRGAQLAEIPGAGHLSHVDNPEAFVAALAAFITA